MSYFPTLDTSSNTLVSKFKPNPFKVWGATSTLSNNELPPRCNTSIRNS